MIYIVVSRFPVHIQTTKHQYWTITEEFILQN